MPMRKQQAKKKKMKKRLLSVTVTIVFVRRKAKLDEILERIQEFHSA